jgi:hypothetical protein
MRVAVLLTYRAGHPVDVTEKEHWGFLTVERFGRGPLRALLKADSNSLKPIIAPLFNVWVVRARHGCVWFAGDERIGRSWHTQIWKCRLVTAHEFHIASLKHGRIDKDPELATYRHWYVQVEEVATTNGQRGHIDIADIIELLEIEQTLVWPFVDWISATNRGHFSGVMPGSRNDMGSIMLTYRTPYDDIPADFRYGEVAPSVAYPPAPHANAITKVPTE